jgi:alcohol dehydrogenase, propanol-preferring
MTNPAATMRAMAFEGVGRPLRPLERPIPQPGPGQLLLRVEACGVCRTDLHLLDGEVAIDSPPRILGHQIVGTVERAGERSPPGTGAEPARERPTAEPGAGTAAEPGAGLSAEPGAGLSAEPGGVGSVEVGARVGVPWLGWTCGECRWCRSGRENLCPRARFTGRDIDGGMAEWTVADARFCFPIPAAYAPTQAAPLLCAGLIGYRALGMCGDAERIGLYGFGAAAHILAQVCRWEHRPVYAVTRPGDEAAQRFARELGAAWAGGSDEPPPEQLDAAIVFAPDGSLVPLALRALAPGGTVVCGGIHMSEIPAFPYAELWQERAIRSVANLTRRDGHEFLALAPRVPVETSVTTYPLEDAGRALEDLRAGRFTGAAVIVP